jgi:hypothetical protein
MRVVTNLVALSFLVFMIEALAPRDAQAQIDGCVDCLTGCSVVGEAGHETTDDTNDYYSQWGAHGCNAGCTTCGCHPPCKTVQEEEDIEELAALVRVNDPKWMTYLTREGFVLNRERGSIQAKGCQEGVMIANIPLTREQLAVVLEQ